MAEHYEVLSSEEVEQLRQAGVTYPWHPRQTLRALDDVERLTKALAVREETVRRLRQDLATKDMEIARLQRVARHDSPYCQLRTWCNRPGGHDGPCKDGYGATAKDRGEPG